MALTIDGVPHVMKLTLGALAELEAALDADTLMQLIERFESGQFTSRDVLAVLAAGLRGGGAEMAAERLAKAEIDGGPVAAVRAAAELIVRAFAVPESP